MEQSDLLQRVSHFPPIEPNLVLLEHAKERAESVQNRVADTITKFAGSMLFVYIHVAWFGLWIGLGIEGYPFGLLTMIVSLEAIFLSTFVMISQNRADAKRQIVADQQLADRQGGRQAEPTAPRPFRADPRADEGDPHLHDSAVLADWMSHLKCRPATSAA
jgi:hypothetical protein